MDNKTEPTIIDTGSLFSGNRTDTEWMTIEEAADYLRTKVSHLRDLVYRNEIPYSKLGRLIRFHRPTVDDWMLNQQGAKSRCRSTK